MKVILSCQVGNRESPLPAKLTWSYFRWCNLGHLESLDSCKRGTKGRCTYDVCIEGGGRSENLPFLQMNSTDRLREMQMKGERGQKV